MSIQEDLPGDQFATKYRRTSTGAFKTDFADIIDQSLRVLLEHNEHSFEYEGLWWSRTKPQDREKWGDGVFKNTPESRAQWKASYNKHASPPPSAQAKIENMPASEYKSLVSTTTDWNPPQLVLVPLRSLTDKAGLATVEHNEQAGWRTIKVIEIQNFFAAVMRKD